MHVSLPHHPGESPAIERCIREGNCSTRQTFESWILEGERLITWSRYMLQRSVLLGYSRNIPSNIDRPLSGTPHLNSSIAVCEMNLICLLRGRLRRARFTIDWIPSLPCFRKLWTQCSQTYNTTRNLGFCFWDHKGQIPSLTLHEFLNFLVILSRSSSASLCCSVLSYIPRRARCNFLGSQYCNALWKVFLTASWVWHSISSCT